MAPPIGGGPPQGGGVGNDPPPPVGDPPGPGNAITLFEFATEFLAKVTIKTTVEVVAVMSLVGTRAAKTPFLVKVRNGVPGGIVLTEILVSDLGDEADAEAIIRRTIEQHNEYVRNRRQLDLMLPMWDADP